MSNGTLRRDLPRQSSEEEAVLLISSDSTIRSHNAALARLLGVPAGRLAGRNLSEFLEEETSDLGLLGSAPQEATGPETIRLSLHDQREEGKTVDVSFQIFSLQGAMGDDLVLVGRATPDIAHEERGVEGLALLPQEDPNPVLRVAASGILEYANRGSWLLLAHWGIEVGGQVPLRWIEMVHDALESREVREVEVDIGFKCLYFVMVPITEKRYVNLYGLDITGRRRVERKLRLDAQVFENAMEAIMITDPDLRIIDVNHAFSRITGYSREEILGEYASVLYSDRHDPSYYENVWKAAARAGSWQGEIWDRRRDGSVYPKWLSVSAVTEKRGVVTRFIAIFSDITILKETEEQLFRMAHYDSLTGLANRRHFMDMLHSDIEAARRTGQALAVMFIDLDGFKLVNDTLGHNAGDELLENVASRIAQTVRTTDTVARIGGDEFTVVLPNLVTAHNAAVLARKILSRITEPYEVGGRELLITSSIGVALYPDDGDEAETLLQCADTAMYRAKEYGKNGYQFSSPDMNTRAHQHLRILTELRRAVDREEFIVQYQPQVYLEDHSLSGLEALVRWNNPDLGLLLPGRFIQIAEEHGMIAEIGTQVFRAVCSQLRAWQTAGMRPVRVAVNLSGYQLKQPDFLRDIEEVIDEFGISATGIEFELTERVIVDDDEATMRKLRHLKELGARLTLDDFGTKYSSLAYLKRLPIDKLKMDRSFTEDLSPGGSEAALAAAIIAMGQRLGMEVLAEGVETEVQAECLLELGCPQAQGFFFGAPADAGDVSRLFKNRKGRTS